MVNIVNYPPNSQLPFLRELGENLKLRSQVYTKVLTPLNLNSIYPLKKVNYKKIRTHLFIQTHKPKVGCNSKEF